jgi:glucosamine-6-phosphate isomerase
VKINIAENYSVLSASVADEITQLLKHKRNAVLCFPSGESPLGLFEVLIERHKQKIIDFSSCTFIGLDEWVGMDQYDQGSCQEYIYNWFFNPLELRPDQIHFFDAKSLHLEEECRRIDDIVKRLGGIDIMVLGIGMNGHLGLNEPGVNASLYSHVVEVDGITKVVGQKYFPKQTALHQGITLGIKHIMESRRVIIIANGTRKADIIQKALEGEITNLVPCSLARNHVNAAVYLDREAAQKLKQ